MVIFVRAEVNETDATVLVTIFHETQLTSSYELQKFLEMQIMPKDSSGSIGTTRTR
ncbi:32680_t:CDS:2, partial [Gigaspora margarita]